MQILTAPYAILIDALSFVASALAIRSIAKPEIRITPRDNCRDFYHQALEGARVVAADQRLLALARTNALAAFSYGSFSALYMLFVVRILGFAPGLLGIIFALGGICSFLSSFGATRLVERFGAGRALAGGLMLQGISWVCVPAAHGATPLAASLLIAQQVFGDAGGTIVIITITAIPQILVPGHILGRVRATISFATTAALIAGSLVAGLAAELAGLRPVMYAGALGMAAAGLLLALAPAWRVAAHDLPMVGEGLIADQPHALQVGR